jgi:hypothetical protein
MDRRSRSKAQAVRDKKALKTLTSTGLYTGKIDLRRAPTPYQQRLIKRYADVVSGRAAVVRPRDPKPYKSAGFKSGPRGAVIVPKAKGERIGLSKTGRITRKRPGRKPATIVPGKKLPAPEAVPRAPAGTVPIFYLPFGRGRGGETYWRAFSRNSLIRFFGEYQRSPKHVGEWLRYLEIEDGTPEYERQLNRIISGDVSAGPSVPVPHSAIRYRASKRAIRRALADEGEEVEEE